MLFKDVFLMRFAHLHSHGSPFLSTRLSCTLFEYRLTKKSTIHFFNRQLGPLYPRRPRSGTYAHTSSPLLTRVVGVQVCTGKRLIAIPVLRWAGHLNRTSFYQSHASLISSGHPDRVLSMGGDLLDVILVREASKSTMIPNTT